MNKLKSLLACAVVVLTFNFLNAQENLQDKANKLVAQMSEKLVNANAEILTLEQEQKLTALYLEKLQEMQKIKKEVADKEEQKEKIKALHKLYGKKIHQTILTQAQKKALLDFKKNNE